MQIIDLRSLANEYFCLRFYSQGYDGYHIITRKCHEFDKTNHEIRRSRKTSCNKATKMLNTV